MTSNHEADWRTVTGERFRERRELLHLTQAQLAEEAGLGSYETVSAVEHGKGSAPSRRKVAAALDRLEEEGGTHAPAPVEEPSLHLIEFEVTGNFGVRVVVKGPVADAREIEESVARLVRDMNSEQA
jgi:transcriptional regulator with XRE-family HTH domain